MLTFSLLAVASCAPKPVASTGPQTIRSVDEAQIQGPFVPAGTRFTARLDRTIDTQTSHRGEQFFAVTNEALTDRSGHVVVPAGARIHGRVRSVEGARGSRIRLEFDGVDTLVGYAPLQARIENADSQRYRGAPEYTARPQGWDSFYGPYYGSYPGGVGGGPVPSLYDEVRPREVMLNAGATLQLVLTRPLLAPGTRIVR
jgi:hypothetical protein